MPVALLSVYDKTGIAELAQTLVSRGWEIWSSGGTAKVLADAEIPVTDVADITGYPPLLGHRVATLHPLIHGGILADVHDATHVRDMDQHGIRAISLVVVNFYPFSTDPGVDLIDIGGPALVRAAAKNHARVGVVVRPQDYDTVAEEIRASGELSIELRRTLALRALRTTSAYDAEIARWLTRGDDGETPLPDAMVLSLEKVQNLRYGENPHQHGARYRIDGRPSWWDSAVQHGGKDLSYLNVFDTDAAWSLVNQFEDPACVIVKHANPCGVAVVEDATIDAVYEQAHACDPVSAFGGIVAVNRTVTSEMARAMGDVFTEVVVAPAFDRAALEILAVKKNLRTISGTRPGRHDFDIRTLDAGLLVQTPDEVIIDTSTWRVVTRTQPAAHQWRDVDIAWRVVSAVSSNAIVLVQNGCAVGIGAGQQNRLDSARIAVERAGSRSIGGVCASDAFFPFRDGLDAVADAGVTVVVQPGGSVRDDEVIAAADERGIAMIFTGRRHFRH